MAISKYPDNFVLVNSQQTKQVSLVVAIEDVPYYFSFSDIYTRVRYGDPDITYGMQGLIYGGLRRVANVKDYLTLEGSLSITQRLEPEQGRGSIQTFNLVLIDKDGLLTQLITPTIVVNEPLGGKQVKIMMGYLNTSFPEDYFTLYLGNITSTAVQGAKISLALSDANARRRQQLADIGTTFITAGVDAVQTVIPVLSTQGFYQKILGPDATYYSNLKLFIKIDEEVMQYSSYLPTSINVTRNAAPIGWFPLGADIHDVNASVSNTIEIGPENAITLALMMMLSGWNGPWTTAQSIRALGTNLDLSSPISNCILLPTNKDGIDDYGLTFGDYITVTGSTAGNDGTYTVVEVLDDVGGLPNRLVLINQTLNIESPCSATFSIRSRYDVLPIGLGLKLKPNEVDVAGHEYVRDNYLSGPEVNLHFYITDKTSGKDFIEKELYFVIGCYSLTRYGKLSIGFTRPPTLLGDKLVTLSADNILNPANIIWNRATNTRRFYNSISYDFDYDANNDIFSSGIKNLDADSIGNFQQTSSLAVQSKGVRTILGGEQLAQNTTRRFLQRFKDAAIEIQVEASFGAGVVIEAGDVVVLKDNGDLKIPNIYTGVRDAGEALYEVINRALDIRTGVTKLTLLSGIQDSRSDRYGLVSPASNITTATTTRLTISGLNENLKWTAHIGQIVLIRSLDYTTYYHETTLFGFDIFNPNIAVVDTLPSAPLANYVMELPKYSTSTDREYQQLYKQMYAYFSPSISILTGYDHFSFGVSPTDAAKLLATSMAVVHSVDYTVESEENIIDSVVGNLVTLRNDLGFTPSAGYILDMTGFPDLQPTYRAS